MTRHAFLLASSQGCSIDPHNGFLPREEPLSRLEGEHELYWEHSLDMASVIPLRFSGGHGVPAQEQKIARRWRKDLREMPILHLSKEQLRDTRYIRRARVVLSFLAHYYIHSQPQPISPAPSQRGKHDRESSDSFDDVLRAEEERGKYKTTIPASIAVSWCIVSDLLELPPILTYADTVLWNWHLTEPSKGIQADNLSMTTTFSGTLTEHHFFKTSLLIELQGAQALKLIQQSLLSAVDPTEKTHHQLHLNLQELSKIIGIMVKIFVEITSACAPSIFYWDVRTWFNGSDTSPTTYHSDGSILQEAGKGWTYQGITSQGDDLKVLTGPSAGQSSVIHALDIFLGVDHTSNGIKESFMHRMQRFMPGPHSRYLTHLHDYLHAGDSATTKQQPHLIKSLCSQSSKDCLAAYNEAIAMLCKLRDQHMRIVALYILIPARQPPPPHHSPLGDNVRVKDNTGSKGERGTGGTELVTFLKGTRDRTRQARLLSIEI